MQVLQEESDLSNLTGHLPSQPALWAIIRHLFYFSQVVFELDEAKTSRVMSVEVLVVLRFVALTALFVDIIRGLYTIFSVFPQMEEFLQKDLIWFLFWRLVGLQQWKVCDCVSEHVCVIEL